MGYFDALTSGYFRTTEDGRRLFFPWGPIGRGYVVGTAEQFRRLRRRIRSYYVVSLPLTIGAVVFAGLLGGAVILPVVIVPYAIWVRIQCRDLALADERLTFTESRINQAREFNTVTLWLLEISSLAFVAAGLFLLVIDLTSWTAGLVGIVFFGLCAFTFARMLMVKRRVAGYGRRSE